MSTRGSFELELRFFILHSSSSALVQIRNWANRSKRTEVLLAIATLHALRHSICHMAFVARAPRTAPFGAATTSQEVRCCLLQPFTRFSCRFVTQMLVQLHLHVPSVRCAVGLPLLTHSPVSAGFQVGPGSYSEVSRHGSVYPSYVPFSTSTQRGFDAEQTSHQVLSSIFHLPLLPRLLQRIPESCKNAGPGGVQTQMSLLVPDCATKYDKQSVLLAV